MAGNDGLLEFHAEWEVAERLVDYATIYLAGEEAIMAAVGYPDLDRLGIAAVFHADGSRI